MKLKYYLRGAGIGLIIATLVMTFSALRYKYNISEDYIIKEARKLGMVMKDEVNGSGGLFGKDETEDDATDDDSELSESTEEDGSEVIPSESETPPASETPPPSEEPETPPSSENGYVTIVIERGDYARQVAEKMYAAGLVPNAEEFRKYIGAHGYGQTIKVGYHNIPIGASYEEICKIITTKR
jgi:hypothetical protein